MVTEVHALTMRALLARLLLSALLLGMFGDSRASGGATWASAPVALAHAQVLFDQQRYREVVDALEAWPASMPRDAAAHLLLGKAYGRLAEHAPWYRAMGYARRCGIELERAVALDPRNREALSALARFYEEAPTLLGGGADKATAVRQRLDALD